MMLPPADPPPAGPANPASRLPAPSRLPAQSQARGGPPPAATWTTPSPTTRAAAPASAICRLCAECITGPSRLEAGPWPSPNPESWPGPPRTAAATPSEPYLV